MYEHDRPKFPPSPYKSLVDSAQQLNWFLSAIILAQLAIIGYLVTRI